MNHTRKLHVVCIGGGTGMPALLRGLKHNPFVLVTAIVNMFDTGGSSGDLRDRFGILPPGDVLKCLLALAENEKHARKLLLRRISNHAHQGHTGGNALLLGLQQVFGNLPEAIQALGQILGVRGEVIPVTTHNAHLVARFNDGLTMPGEVAIDACMREGKRVEHLWLEPAVPAYDKALLALREADIICIGPGSFYTSVLPNFLPDGVAAEIQMSAAPTIFIANLLTEGKGMQNMYLEDIVIFSERFTGRKTSYVVANTRLPDNAIVYGPYGGEHKYPVQMRSEESESCGPTLPSLATIAVYWPK
jgi:uncharacterized cofD-like protein